jgi:hypothetical protein
MNARTIAILLVLPAALLAGCRSRPAPPPVSAGGSSTATPEARKDAFNAAVKALSKQINAPRDAIAGVSQEEATWNDACLGCPKAGEKCAQVLTPGYRVILRVSEATYEYHTDLGGRARLCGQTIPPTPTAIPTAAPTPQPTPPGG